jgi:response regulator RpfG family c-di-GMP phosphodiesterase
MSKRLDRPRVLLVDDEPHVIESIAVNLRKEYEVITSTNGADALQILKTVPEIAVVVSDMRMPVMDGADLLYRVRMAQGDVARIVLTGHADAQATASAINRGQVLRFLSKPCSIESLKEALEAGVAHYRVTRAERAVMQETLVGCIHALVDLLALSNPLAFGRASRVQRIAMKLAGLLGLTEFWQLECAAMLSQIGYIGLPEALVQKLYRGESLSDTEAGHARQVPKVAMQMLDHVPRLEPIIQILDASSWPDPALARLGDGMVGTGARILALALDYDALAGRGLTADQVMESLRAHESRYGREMLDKYADHVGAPDSPGETRLVTVREIQVGMIILQDLCSPFGALLATRGYKVTKAFCERLGNFNDAMLAQTVRVSCPPVVSAPPG